VNWKALPASPFGEYLRASVWRPASIDHMVVDEVTAIVPNRAQGYFKGQNGHLRNSTLMDSSYKSPGGGVAWTAADLVQLAIAMQNGKLLKPATVAQMWQGTKLPDGSMVPYGLGWQVGEWKGQRNIQHGGAQQRAQTLLFILPDKALAWQSCATWKAYS